MGELEVHLYEPLRNAHLDASGNTYVTYFDILKISNCRLGSRGFARQKCPTPMGHGRCEHSPTRRAEASFSFAIL